MFHVKLYSLGIYVSRETQEWLSGCSFDAAIAIIAMFHVKHV